MVSFNVIQNTINLLISYTLLAKVQPITTTNGIIESEINDVITEFIDQDITNNETLLNEVKMAIEYVLLQKKNQKIELHRTGDTISEMDLKSYLNEHKIKRKLKDYFRALCIFKAGSLIDYIEERLQPKDPPFCDNCLGWGHEEINCTNKKPLFLAWDEDIQSYVQARRNHWYWMLKHRRDDVDIGRLSDYLKSVYHSANFTILFNFTADQMPANFNHFKLIFCFALGEILQRRNYLKSIYGINYEYFDDFPIAEISMDKYVEIFLKALDKWVDFEEPVFLHRDDDSIEETRTTSPLKPEIDKVLNLFNGKDISSNETLLQQMKNVIQHVLLQKQNLQLRVSINNEIIRRKTKEIEANYSDLYNTKLKTFFKALCIYKLAATFEKPNIERCEETKPPLCSNCLNWGHTVDNCNSSNVTFGGNVSISRDVYNWFWMLDHPDTFDGLRSFLPDMLQKSYDSGNFTNVLKPKPENFLQFKLICCEALAKIHQVEYYLTTRYRFEPQMEECNVFVYGVPLFEHVIFFFRQLYYSDLCDELFKEYSVLN